MVTSRLTDLQPDLLAVNETWLDESVEDFALEGYTKVSRLDRRDGRQGGGIMLFAKDAFRNCVHLEDSPCAELSWHMLHTSLGPVLLAVWYRAPDADSSHLLSMMAEWRRLSEGAIATIILGDLNIHQRKWLRFSSANTCEGERLQQFCMGNNLRQLVQSPTRDHHLLALVITDLQVPVRTSVLPKVADHGIVQAVFAMPAPSVKLIPREVWLFQKAKWGELNDAFSRVDWRAVLPSDVNGAVDTFSKMVLQTSARFIPRVWRRTRKSTHPWLNERCRVAIRRKMDAEGSARYADERAVCSAILSDEYNKYATRLREHLASLPRGSKAWWRISKALLGKPLKASPIPAMKSGCGEWATEAADKADLLAETFAAKSSLPEFSVEPDIGEPIDMCSDFLVLRLRWAVRWLKAIHPSKATGPDMIPGIILKKCAIALARAIARIARLILDPGVRPSAWGTHWIVPSFKIGLLSEPKK